MAQKANVGPGQAAVVNGVHYRAGDYLPEGTTHVDIVWWYQPTPTEIQAGAHGRQQMWLLNVPASQFWIKTQGQFNKLRAERLLTQQWWPS